MQDIVPIKIYEYLAMEKVTYLITNPMFKNKVINKKDVVILDNSDILNNLLKIGYENVGYFSDFVVEDMEHVLEEINGKEFESRKYRLLKAMIDKEVVYAVNEIRIENPFHTLISEVYVNGSYLETFRGNGLVVSTSIGSTAYNKSLGGAVVEPYLEVMQVNEIAPINNRLFSSLGSSLVLSDKNVVTFKGDYSKVLVGYDYLIKSELHTNEIKIELSDKRVSVLSKKAKTYINKLSDSFVMRK